MSHKINLLWTFPNKLLNPVQFIIQILFILQEQTYVENDPLVRGCNVRLDLCCSVRAFLVFIASPVTIDWVYAITNQNWN